MLACSNIIKKSGTMNEKEKDDLKNIVDKIVEDAFKRINYAYQHHREKEKDEDDEPGNEEIATRLIFPKCANNGTRISEQELRFAFVEAFNASQDVKEKKLFYSVETPTEKRYKGFSEGKPEQSDSGRSGEFDLVIFDDNFNRRCLIEFKANTASENDHKKDLLKLKEEGMDNRLRYFIEVLKSYDNDTIIELHKRVFGMGFHNEDKNTIFKCYALGGQSRKKSKGEDISDLFNLANLHQEDTGVDAVIWVSHKWPNREPFMMVESLEDKAPKVSISIEDKPKVLEPKKQSNGDVISAATRWICLNKQLLLDYWNDEMYPTSKMLKEIKKLK